MPTKPDVSILSRLVKNLQRRGEDPLRPYIDEYLMQRDRVSSAQRLREYLIDMVPRPRPPGRLSPSTIGGCQRAAVFKFIGVRGRRRIDPDTELKFDDGNWRHHRWQATFKDMECVLGAEHFQVLGIEEPVIYPKLYIAGNLDARLLLEQERHIVVDVKGINDAGFQRVMSDDAPLEPHRRQVVTYGQSVEHELAPPEHYLLYDNKNNQLTKGFVVEETAALWKGVRQWCKEVLAFLDRRRLPPKDIECSSGSFLYEKCPYSRLCFGRHDSTELQEMTYKNFNGTRVHWRRANELPQSQG